MLVAGASNVPQASTGAIKFADFGCAAPEQVFTTAFGTPPGPCIWPYALGFCILIDLPNQ